MQYRPEIDGLRCFAIIPVILFHMNSKVFIGGYLGVDVFFVISGFLITSIILKEIQDGSFSLRKFWARRVRRILPAMIAMVLVSTIAYKMFLFRPDLAQFTSQKNAVLLSVSNIYFWLQTGDYWGQEASNSPYLHCWSLSVEEQFYLFFPLILFVVFKFFPKRLMELLALAMGISLAVYLYASQKYPSAAFYLLPTRSWELGVGCMLAVFTIDQRFARVRLSLARFKWGALAGASAITFSYLHPAVRGISAFGTVAAVFGSALVILNPGKGVVFSLLSSKFSVYVGKVSYSLYLWHWPTIVFFKFFGDAKGLVISPLIQWVSMLVATIVSYYAVEQIVRRKADVMPLIAGGYLVTLVLLGFENRFANSYDVSRFNQSAWNGLLYDVRPDNKLAEGFKSVCLGVTVPVRQAPATAIGTGGVISPGTKASPEIVVLGDSHAVTWAGVIDEIARELRITTSFYAIAGANPFPEIPVKSCLNPAGLTSDEKFVYDTSRLNYIAEWKPKLVIVSARWSNVKTGATDDLFKFLELNAGATLLIENPPVVPLLGNRNLAQFLSYRGIFPKDGMETCFGGFSNDELNANRTRLLRIIGDHHNFSYLSVADLYQKDGKILVLSGRNAVYLDDDHLTEFGTRLARQRLRAAIVNLVKQGADEGGK